MNDLMTDKKIAVYTCITGGYDKLNEFSNQDPDIDFICFTDQHINSFRTTNWTFRNIPQDLTQLSNVKQQRLVKILPHMYLPEYDITLWVDGNMRMIGNMMDFISEYDLEKHPFYTRKHPSRKCIYEEARAVIRLRRDTAEHILPQIGKYRESGFPENYGLEETGLILRDNRNMKCKLTCNMWAKEILNGSHRDQLSFDYCRWRTGLDIGYLNVTNFRRDKYFRMCRHG